ncbi:low molecular weight phosphatase family protein [Allohahella sp. A8]|uniref:arsenate-mycothiol transferase ArsC n=1 Tax=Allohahella sp. A8 TaxID=3141461 RepID=UPI003A80EC91
MTSEGGLSHSVGIVRIDQLTDTIEELRLTVTYWRQQKAPPLFLSGREWEHSCRAGFHDQNYCLLIIVVAHTQDYLLAARELLEEENIPFVSALLVPHPDEIPWVRQIYSLLPALEAAAERGVFDLNLKHGAGSVRYMLHSPAARSSAIKELLRRCSVVPKEQLAFHFEAIAQGCELALGAEVAESFRTYAHSDISVSLDADELHLVQNPYSVASTSVLSKGQDDFHETSFGKLIPASWLSCYFERWGLLGPPQPVEGLLDLNLSEHKAVFVLHSVQQRLVSLPRVSNGIIPSLSLPKSKEHVEGLKLRLLRVNSRAADGKRVPGTLNIFDRWGGKRALLTLLNSNFQSLVGLYNRYKVVRFEEVTRVVFFCKGNINRSAYAVARLKSLGFKNTISFGVSARPGDAASVEALERAAREGMSLLDHVATSLNDFEVCSGDLLVGFEAQQVRQVQAVFSHDSGAVQYTLAGLWSDTSLAFIQDPIVRSPEYFELCFNRISQAVEGLQKKLLSCRPNMEAATR